MPSHLSAVENAGMEKGLAFMNKNPKCDIGADPVRSASLNHLPCNQLTGLEPGHFHDGGAKVAKPKLQSLADGGLPARRWSTSAQAFSPRLETSLGDLAWRMKDDGE
jgi:hypothetical protein